MSKKKSQKVNVPRKVKEDLKNDSSNVENTKIELPQLPQPFLIKQEEQNKPWYKKNISIIISLVSLIITAFMSYQTIENNLKNQERNSYLDTTNFNIIQNL